MSLINDALKRASQSDRNRPRPPSTHASMEPVAGGRSWSLSLSLGIGVVVAMALAGWFFWQWWNTGHSNEPVKMAAPAVVAPKPAPAALEAVPPPKPVEPPTPVTTAPPTPTVPPPAPAPPAKPAEAPWPAELKLMGIFFNKTNPHALINGKTVAPGDSINGIRVATIESDRVTVEWNGRVKQIILGGN